MTYISFPRDLAPCVMIPVIFCIWGSSTWSHWFMSLYCGRDGAARERYQVWLVGRYVHTFINCCANSSKSKFTHFQGFSVVCMCTASRSLRSGAARTVTFCEFYLMLTMTSNAFVLICHVSIRICTLACHALMVPCLLRRAREGFQGPEYQLEAVELAVMRWSSISPPSIPRGTEQPESGG